MEEKLKTKTVDEKVFVFALCDNKKADKIILSVVKKFPEVEMINIREKIMFKITEILDNYLMEEDFDFSDSDK